MMQPDSPPPTDPPAQAGPPAGPARFSLSGQAFAAGLFALLVFAVPVLLAPKIPFPHWVVVVLSLAAAVAAGSWAMNRAMRPVGRTMRALSDGIRSFKDHDFSVRLASTRRDELGQLTHLYNLVGETLQKERAQIRQRELLLQTALDHSPIAILLVNPLDRILYANQEARRLFTGGRRLEGLKFAEIVESCPREMRHVMGSSRDGVFSVETEDGFETYHLAERSFYLNRNEHRLYLLRRMTAELTRQEAEIWKRVIRIISHELNNSLAPISSLAHSGVALSQNPSRTGELQPLYASIRERVDHLTAFLEGYARFARLPQPQVQTVDWGEWIGPPSELYSFDLEGALPSRPGQFDPAQLQQALINLLKNAVEASNGRPEITVAIIYLPERGFRIQVKDRGSGMDEVVMRQALLPFYSTKASGSGVGLALCREIVEAHGGSIRIQSRQGGGTVVTLWIPAGQERSRSKPKE